LHLVDRTEDALVMGLDKRVVAVDLDEEMGGAVEDTGSLAGDTEGSLAEDMEGNLVEEIEAAVEGILGDIGGSYNLEVETD
jgi:hypothetical protein